MAENASSTKVVTGEVRLSYVHVFEPYAQANDDGSPGDPKYSCVILIPKSDKATLRKLKAARQAAAEKGAAKHFGGKVPANVKHTLHDGDEEADLERNPEYAGHYYMSVSSKTKPGIVDRAVNPILDQSEVYSGCYARVSINAFSYSVRGNKGVSFALNHVQKLRDGEPLGGATRAEDEFDAVDDEEFAEDLVDNDDEESLI